MQAHIVVAYVRFAALLAVDDDDRVSNNNACVTITVLFLFQIFALHSNCLLYFSLTFALQIFRRFENARTGRNHILDDQASFASFEFTFNQLFRAICFSLFTTNQHWCFVFDGHKRCDRQCGVRHTTIAVASNSLCSNVIGYNIRQ